MFGFFSFISYATRRISKRKPKEKEENFEKLLKKSSFHDLSEFEKVQALCIESAMQVAREGEGALFVVGSTKNYSSIFPNFFKSSKFSVFDKGMQKVLVKLAQIDGAVIIDKKGKVRAYGAHVSRSSVVHGAGTRHAAAKGISKEGNIAILASEEDRVVRVFRQGKQVVEINPNTKNVETHVSKIVKFVNSPETAVAAGAAIAIPFLGIPGVVVFAGSYYVAKKILGLAKKG